MAGESTILFSSSYETLMEALINKYSPNGEDLRVILLRELNEEELNNLSLATYYGYNPPTSPNITSIPSTQVYIDSHWVYTITVNDPDTLPENLIYTAEGMPNGMVLDKNILIWKPTAIDTYGPIKITVSDGHPGTRNAIQTFSINVNAQGGPLPPELPVETINAPQYGTGVTPVVEDLGYYEIEQSESYLTGGKPITGPFIVKKDADNVIFTSDNLSNVKWTDLTAKVHGFAIISNIRIDPNYPLYEIVAYQYLNNNMIINKDDLVIKFPELNINGVSTPYILRFEVK